MGTADQEREPRRADSLTARANRLRALLRGQPEPDPAFSSALVEHLADAVVAVDADGRFVTLNRRARESAEGFPARAFPSDVPMEEWAAYFSLYPRGGSELLATDELPLVRALRGESIRNMELESRGEGGARAFLNASGGPVLDASGQIQGAVVVLQDITARVAMEERLLLQSAIVSHLDAGVALVRAADGEIVYANEKWDQMFGYEPGELVGQPIAVVNAPTGQSPEERAREILDALDRDGTWTGEVHNVRKDGTQMWCEVNVTRFEHPVHGTLWVAANTEISARREAREDLQRAERRFRTVFEQAPLGIVLIGKDNQLMDFNDAFCETLGYGRDELVGMPMAAFVHPDDRELDAHLVAQLFGGQIARYRVGKRCVAKDGRVVPVTLTVSLAHAADSRPLYAIATVEEASAS